MSVDYENAQIKPVEEEKPTKQEVRKALAQPFPVELLEFKPGAMNKQNNTGVALAFVTWTEYAKRLDEICPGRWSVSIPGTIKMGEDAVVVLVDLVIDWVNYPGISDPKTPTSAFDQAFKRACALAGLGRYLYDMPQEWLTLDERGKKFVENSLSIAVRYYDKLGLDVPADVRARAKKAGGTTNSASSSSDSRTQARPTGNAGTNAGRPATSNGSGGGKGSGAGGTSRKGKPTEPMLKSLRYRHVPEHVIERLDFDTASAIIGALKDGDELSDVLEVHGFGSDPLGDLLDDLDDHPF